MASGRLGSHTSSGAVTYDLYEVPTGKSAEVNVNVYNNSGGIAKVTLFRAPTGTPSATHTIQVDSIPLGESYQRTALVLFAGEHLMYKTNVAGVTVVHSIEDAIDKAKELGAKEIFVIGGGEIYKQSMEIADKIYMTRVHVTLDGDTFFPEIDETKWQLSQNQDFGSDEKHKYAYSFQTWQRK